MSKRTKLQKKKAIKILNEAYLAALISGLRYNSSKESQNLEPVKIIAPSSK